MQRSNKQAYDRSSNILSPEGRLYQVEYAREAISNGSPSVGVQTDDGVAFAVERSITSDLLDEQSIEKLYRVDSHIATATAGHVADGRKLVEKAREIAQLNQLRFGGPISVHQLSKYMTDFLQEYTQMGGARPFASALLFGGVNSDDSVELFEIDPSGTPYKWSARAVGGGSSKINNFLEDEYEEEMTLTEATELAVRGVGFNSELTPDEVAVARLHSDELSYELLSQDEVRELLSDFDLLDEGDNQ